MARVHGAEMKRRSSHELSGLGGGHPISADACPGEVRIFVHHVDKVADVSSPLRWDHTVQRLGGRFGTERLVKRSPTSAEATTLVTL